MTHPFLTRAHLEAVLVALAAVRHDLAPELAACVDRRRLSPSAWALLEQLAYPTLDFRRQPGDVHTATVAQRSLADRVDRITVADICCWPVDVLLALVNRLPERNAGPKAWERDLAAGLETAEHVA
jgi:hypothetical protein